MFERFLALTAATPTAAAVIDGETGEVTSRAQLAARIDELAAGFAEFTRGDVIAIQLPNSVDMIAAFGAVLKRKLVAILIDRDGTESEVGNVLSHFNARGLVYRRGNDVMISTRAAVRPNLPAGARLIKLTSGSTGMPKGIVATETNLRADCINICATMDIRPDDINLGAIPMSHSYGFSNLVTPLLVQGTAVVISNDYLPQSVLNLCNRFSCTVAPLIPMVFDHLITAGDGEFKTVRTFLSAGAPLPPSVSRRFRERFGIPIHTFYGCSECGGITYDREGAAVERGTVGRAMENVTLTSKRGRLIVRGDNVALGYLHDAITFQPFDDGVFVTDDLIDVRENGEIAITGRASELINTAGKKVNPREVEQVLLRIDGVREAKVYGEPAGARGDVVAAAVVADPDVTREQIRAWCLAHLSPHKVPRIVKLIESIPVDERGKVKRAALAAL
ncbi:MAG TPA: class I adenylate-forming enzyme family protein [Thermoanaerobaculia bacterium]|jgi:acyl-CoA synthetase (AMP-forming)/AMP-acid ligase II|nr:class I adenylate-forming enzyme family protein [Thermoanaerobaculia bacterium]